MGFFFREFNLYFKIGIVIFFAGVFANRARNSRELGGFFLLALLLLHASGLGFNEWVLLFYFARWVIQLDPKNSVTGI